MWSALPGAVVRHGEALEEILREYPDDFGVGGPEWPGFANFQMPPRYEPGLWTEPGWNVIWRQEARGMVGHPVGCPLENWEALADYEFPRVDPEEIAATAATLRPSMGFDGMGSWQPGVEPVARPVLPDWYVMPGGGTLYERLQQLRGFENLLMDLATDDPRLYDLRDRVADYWRDYVAVWARQEIMDCYAWFDDWGTQQALMIRPEKWRQFFKPAYDRIFAPLRAADKDIHFHSDGFVRDIIPDLIEIGVKIVWVQVFMMGIEQFGRDFRGKVCVRTDLDRQHVLPHGTPAEVRDHVRQAVENLALPEGGLILHAEIGPDVPLENIRALAEAYVEYGALYGSG
jgi:hypothetical protein